MLRRTPDEDALVARLHVVLAEYARPGHPELLQQQFGGFQGLIVAAHRLAVEGDQCRVNGEELSPSRRGLAQLHCSQT